jgi:hypothetical protein
VYSLNIWKPPLVIEITLIAKSVNRPIQPVFPRSVFPNTAEKRVTDMRRRTIVRSGTQILSASGMTAGII